MIYLPQIHISSLLLNQSHAIGVFAKTCSNLFIILKVIDAESPIVIFWGTISMVKQSSKLNVRQYPDGSFMAEHLSASVMTCKEGEDPARILRWFAILLID